MNRSINSKYDMHRMFCDQSSVGDREGDVRICKHGKIQLNYGLLGLAGGIWVDLSPFWHPIKYNRAKKVLLSDEVLEEPIEGYEPTPGRNIFADSLQNSIIHFYSTANTDAPLCQVGDLGEWVEYDHTAIGKICSDCQRILGREIR